MRAFVTTVFKAKRISSLLRPGLREFAGPLKNIQPCVTRI
jgi:hypothetical protein